MNTSQQEVEVNNVQEEKSEVVVSIEPTVPTQPLMSARGLVRGALWSFVACLIALIGVWFYGFYRGGWQSGWITAPARVLHMPVAVIGGDVIPAGRLYDGIALLSAARRADPTSVPADASPRANSDFVLSRLVQLHVLEELAKKYDISIKSEDAEVVYAARGMAIPNDTELKTLGVSREVFDYHALYPMLLAEKVGLATVKDTEVQKDQYAAAEAARTRIVEGKEDFAKVAKEVSQDTVSGANGGDLDWFGKGVMVPEFEDVAFALQPGQVSDIVVSPYGFHIIKLEGKRTNPKTKEEEIRARHILIAARPLADIATSVQNELSVWRLVHWK